MQFVGKINIPTTGPYGFFTNSDDGSRLFIDGALVATSDGPHGTVETGGAVMLTSGLHDIRIDYVNSGSTGSETLAWQGPGIAKATVPASALFAAENLSGTGRRTPS